MLLFDVGFQRIAHVSENMNYQRIDKFNRVVKVKPCEAFTYTLYRGPLAHKMCYQKAKINASNGEREKKHNVQRFFLLYQYRRVEMSMSC